VPGNASEQLEVRERTVGQYLLACCASHSRPERLDPSALIWSFLTPGLAHWFLTAIDEGVV
jgi:hypothetical protein